MHAYGALLYLFPMAVVGIVVKDSPPPNEYKYSYEIEDPTTGDTKSQHEVRRGDVVSGSYSVVDPDGTRRTVKYTADPEHGFTAVIHREAAAPPPPPPPQPYAYQDIGPQHRVPLPYDNDDLVVKSPPSVGPVLYTKLFTKLLYPKSNYDDKPAFYFTPANEIKSDRESFAQGQYFQPATGFKDYN
ncbi:cuticle protein 8-like [Leguminivora glycinivorella]|uniref:cuticle protein 8-like n=1 Tax=Leguminivora glycinivorella TaxID=1035111 RepID=UPI00200EE1B1|nr:cuticle protein 8-like [Leguminivora glycinivorella]